MKTRALLLGAVGLCASTLAFGDFSSLTKALNVVSDNAGDIAKGLKAGAGFSLDEELAIGESVSLEIIAKYGGLVRDEEITRRVNLVGLSLARYSDRPELPWRFGVLNSDTVNAFSAPGGYVFITRGLYSQATSDDLLAGILGHEIGHITAKHALNIVRRGEFAEVAGNQATKHNKNLQQAQSVANQVQSQVAQVSPEFAKMIDVSAGKIVKTLLEKGFDPKSEYAADRLGHDLAASTGYAPGGLRAVLIGLESSKGDPKTLFPTHPPLKDRVSKLPDEPAPGQ